MIMARPVIIEGVDNVGKTRLAKALNRPTTVHLTKPSGFMGAFIMYSDYFDAVSGVQSPTVWDRGHLSEVVYGGLYRDGGDYGWLWGMEARTIADHAVLVLLDPVDVTALPYDGEHRATREEVMLFKTAFNRSQIQRKMVVPVPSTGVLSASDLLETLKLIRQISQEH